MTLRSIFATAAVAGMLTGAVAQDDAPPPPADAPFTLDLPEWDPDPESLPPELRPIDVVRPELPAAAAAQLAALEAEIELQQSWQTRETPDAQDVALDEAIELSERVLALRVEHQGNTPELVRWRDAQGDPAEWHEIAGVRQTVEHLRRVRALDDAARAELASLEALDAEIMRLAGAGQNAEALVLIQRELETCRSLLGDDDGLTLASIRNTGILLKRLVRLHDAEPYFQEALEGRRRVLGTDHPETLDSVQDVGLLLWEQGRLAEAEPYYTQALEGRRRVLGEDHPKVLDSIGGMGLLLDAQGRLAEAEPFWRRTLASFRELRGDDHPDTLIAVNNMAALLESQGRYAEGERHYRQALRGCRSALGETHPLSLTLMNNLALLLREQGRLVEAEPYLRQSLEGRRRALGDEHPDTLQAVNNMGGLLEAQGRPAEAERHYRDALERFKDVLGATHPRTLTSLNNMGNVLKAQGRLADAEPYYRQALEGRRRALGDEHPETLTSLATMGFLLHRQGRIDEAEPYYRQALDGRRRALGDEHPDTLVSIRSMGFFLEADGRFAEAEPLYREALATAERLRVDVIGGAQQRATIAGTIKLPGIAAAYALTLIELDRAPEALAVLERGRARAGLDLMAGGASEAERVLRASADVDALAGYDDALALEDQARAAVFEAEGRMAAAPDEKKAEWRTLVKAARVTLADRTAAVFAELRGLVPAADPLAAGEVLAALEPGEALLSYSWTRDGAVALVARDGEVEGAMLAENDDESAALLATIAALRERIATRATTDESVPQSMLSAARAAFLPDALGEMLAGASSLTVIADGPLTGVPLELLLEGTPIAYAPSATIAIDRRRAADQRTTQLVSAVVVGAPVFGGGETRPEPGYPETGVLLAMVRDGSNADTAGLRRGDVLLTYGEHALGSATELGPAIGATAETLATRGTDGNDRPVRAEAWRDGAVIEVALATGRMGVQLDQRPPAQGLRSMAFLDRSADTQAADATALEQVRLYGGSLSPLPATRLEASAVAAMLGSQSTLLLGADATAPRLRDAVVEHPPRVLHLATHGLLGSADRPLLASLALTPPAVSGPDDIGFLTLEEILASWGGSLRGTELVVLSACDTGLGVQRGGTTMALPLGFFVCGAETVIASLWRVDDRATALLMTRMYENFLGTHDDPREIHGRSYPPGTEMTKLDALDEARRWLRELTAEEVREAEARIDDLIGASTMLADTSGDRGAIGARPASDAGGDAAPDRPFEHPYYWAAFVLYGSPE